METAGPMGRGWLWASVRGSRPVWLHKPAFVPASALSSGGLAPSAQPDISAGVGALGPPPSTKDLPFRWRAIGHEPPCFPKERLFPPNVIFFQQPLSLTAPTTRLSFLLATKKVTVWI